MSLLAVLNEPRDSSAELSSLQLDHEGRSIFSYSIALHTEMKISKFK